MIIGILRILAIGLIPASLLLAIMSRKNFSKYKSVGIFGGIVLRVRRLLAGGICV